MTLDTSLPLLVALPLLVSALMVVVRRTWFERIGMVGVPLITTIVAAFLLAQTQDGRILATNVGGFPNAVAINFLVDPVSALLMVIMGAITAVSALMLIQTEEDRRRFVPPLVLLLHTGVNGALITADLFNLFVFIEVMLMPSYALIAVTGSWRRLAIGRTFLLVNILTGTLLLIAVGFVYGVTGTVNLAELHNAGDDPRTAAALGFVLFTLAVKAGAVPVHGWLPRAYSATSGAMMTLFSALHTKIALYAIYRIHAVAFSEPGPVLGVVGFVAVLTMIIGSLGSYGETRVRAILGYQMVAGIGHILLGLALFTGAAFTAGLFYTAHHVLTMAALLTSAAAIEHTYGSGRLARLGGLMKREKVLALTTIVGLFSLIGMPPTSGTWGKIGLVMAAASARGWTAAVFIAAVVLASIASIMALQHLWREVFWGPLPHEYLPDDPKTGRGEPALLTDEVRVPQRLKIIPVALTCAVICVFFATGPIMPLFTTAGEALANTTQYVEAVLP